MPHPTNSSANHSGSTADQIHTPHYLPQIDDLKPFLISIPHSGEQVPIEATWLHALPETLLMFDVDRYVDRLYAPVIRGLQIPFITTPWHRYAIDLNRLPDDVDADSVDGHANPSGKFPRGLHWSITTTGQKLMPFPMAPQLHDLLVAKYFEPFHHEVRAVFAAFKQKGWKTVYHIDAHSMPSMGTQEHPDPGNRRADAVISDVSGSSCSPWFRDLVVGSYEAAGFNVSVNWPYKGGRVTQIYGKPNQGQETIQVELNRALYMDEQTKKLNYSALDDIQLKLARAIRRVHDALPSVQGQDASC